MSDRRAKKELMARLAAAPRQLDLYHQGDFDDPISASLSHEFEREIARATRARPTPLAPESSRAILPERE